MASGLVLATILVLAASKVFAIIVVKGHYWGLLKILEDWPLYLVPPLWGTKVCGIQYKSWRDDDIVNPGAAGCTKNCEKKTLASNFDSVTKI